MIHKIIIPTPFAVGDVNAFLVKGDALSLVDAGPKTPEAYEALKRGIQEAGYQLKEIEQVFLTHHHPDHSGWIDAFDNAQVLGHAYNDLWLKRDQDFFDYHDEFYLQCLIEENVPEAYHQWVEKMKRPVRFMGDRSLDVILKEGEAVPGHPNWKVLETLGHARSHLAFWNEKEGAMIGGDLVLANVSSNPIIEPPANPTDGRPKSLLEYNHSLRRIQDLSVDTIYSGHGEEIRNVRELITKRLDQQHDRAMKVLAMMENQPRTIFEMTQLLFPSVYERELGLTLSETIGQADYLVAEGYAVETRDENSGVLYYRKA